MLDHITHERALPIWNRPPTRAVPFGISHGRARCLSELPTGARPALWNLPQARARPFGISYSRAPCPLRFPTGARPTHSESPTSAHPEGPLKTMDELRSSARTCPVSTPNAGHARGALVLGRNAQLQHGPPDCSPLGNPKNVSRLGKTLIFEELWSSAGTCAASVPHAWHKGSAPLPRRNAHAPRAPRLATARKPEVPFSLLWKEPNDQARPCGKTLEARQ